MPYMTVGILPSTIQRVLINPGPPVGVNGWCGTSIISRLAGLQTLNMAKQDKRVYILEARDIGAEIYCRDRIEGGMGVLELIGPGCESGTNSG